MQLNLEDSQEWLIRNALGVYRSQVVQDAEMFRQKRDPASVRLAKGLDSTAKQIDEMLSYLENQESYEDVVAR